MIILFANRSGKLLATVREFRKLETHKSFLCNCCQASSPSRSGSRQPCPPTAFPSVCSVVQPKPMSASLVLPPPGADLCHPSAVCSTRQPCHLRSEPPPEWKQVLPVARKAQCFPSRLCSLGAPPTSVGLVLLCTLHPAAVFPLLPSPALFKTWVVVSFTKLSPTPREVASTE